LERDGGAVPGAPVILSCLQLALKRRTGWARSGPLSKWNRTSARRSPRSES